MKSIFSFSMIYKSDSPKQNIPETRSKRQSLFAIFLGLLTFVVTPVVIIVIALPFLLFKEISEAYNPIVINKCIFDIWTSRRYDAA